MFSGGNKMIDRIQSPSIIASKSKPIIENYEKVIDASLSKTNKAEEVFFHDKKKVEEVIKGLNDFLSPTHTSLKFELHEKLNEYYVTLVDDQTREVVKEIPSKKMLDFYAAMTEAIGLMIDKKI